VAVALTVVAAVIAPVLIVPLLKCIGYKAGFPPVLPQTHMYPVGADAVLVM
jgi:hypothetical protein